MSGIVTNPARGGVEVTPKPGITVPAAASAPVREPGAILRAIPNWLTASRVIMAAIFFGVLTAWRWDGSAAEAGKIDWLMLGAALLFIVAVITDAFDGYLARRWKVESAFGRIMDPFADKILVMGAFVYLASPDFWVQLPGTPNLAGHGIQVSGIYPWMVVVMLARELLVTSIRGVMESQGVSFSSDWWGKGKMILQSIIVPLVLALIAIAPVVPRGGDGEPLAGTLPWGYWAINGVVWLTLLVTVVSGVPYVMRCAKILADQRRELRGNH